MLQRAFLRGTLLAVLETAAARPRHGDASGGLHRGKFILPEAVPSPPDMCYVTCLPVFLQIRYFNKQKKNVNKARVTTSRKLALSLG